MPAARLLLLAAPPPAAPQLQLLRSATTTTAAAFHHPGRTCSSGSSNGNGSTKDGRRKSLKQPAASQRHMSTSTAATSPSFPPSTSVFRPSSSRTALPPRRGTRRLQEPVTKASQTPATSSATAPFSTATVPRMTSFPRHGKAVEPQQQQQEELAKEEGSKDEDAKTKAADKASPEPKAPSQTKDDASSSADKAASGKDEEKRPPKKSKRSKESETVQRKEDAGSNTTATANKPPVGPSRAWAADPPSASVDARKELSGDSLRTDGVLAGTDSAEGPAAVASQAAAAAATAAEAASVAAEVLQDTSTAAATASQPVIELGAPATAAIGAILKPGDKPPGSDNQNAPRDGQQQQQQQMQEQEPLLGAEGLPVSLLPPTLRQSSAGGAASSLSTHPPHLTPPPYVHHFDSYSLVKQLIDAGGTSGGFSPGQAITTMKAVRSLLAQNLDVAQASLVSKADVENEAYLFKAACAELSIEVRNNRRRADELLRQQRTLLQHEVDIAAQSVNQELGALGDAVRGLFNDRKMAVREEQKTLESAIQQLNYKITIMLQSEMRSEIEGLRWVLIRRSVLGIIFMAILTLGSLRYASYLSHEKTKAAEAERAAAEAQAAALRQNAADGKADLSAAPDAAEILAAN